MPDQTKVVEEIAKIVRHLPAPAIKRAAHVVTAAGLSTMAGMFGIGKIQHSQGTQITKQAASIDNLAAENSKLRAQLAATEKEHEARHREESEKFANLMAAVARIEGKFESRSRRDNDG